MRTWFGWVLRWLLRSDFLHAEAAAKEMDRVLLENRMANLRVRETIRGADLLLLREMAETREEWQNRND